jgi:xylulose-5-phosphate/fructose-6-phosphate phosphoketolase
MLEHMFWPIQIEQIPFERRPNPVQGAMGDMDKPEHVRILERWMKSYRPDELFDANGKFSPELAPKGHRRMSDNPHANGGLLLRELKMPDFRASAVDPVKPGATSVEATRLMGRFLRDVMKLNLESNNFRLFSPDENNSNRWQEVLEVTNRCYVAEILPEDDHLAPDGRVLEVLSEHQCQGWLEGYLLTGRHGFFSCYEAFIHIIDSMFNQHAKWLKVSSHIAWRRPIASLNYLLSSHVWRQDHNGFVIKTRASSTMLSTKRPRSSASTSRLTPTASSALPTTVSAVATT